ncbi:MAG: exodeoxyribonuclease III, partial [Rhodospirillaceae bacterium]|nr:exodeoxyribonuclease III [Rhodospirillaceae bacterium]
MTRIATFNVNSIKARMANVLAWLDEFDPDIVLFQEIKSTEESFPWMELEAAGYNIAISGQKSYNGVAIFSKTPLEVVHTRLPGDDGDDQARYIEAVTETGAGVLRVASIYLPNGNPVDTDKFAYKLAWMERLVAHARGLLELEEPIVLGGDYNVIPQDEDCHDPAAWRGDALFRPESRAAFRRLL